MGTKVMEYRGFFISGINVHLSVNISYLSQVLKTSLIEVTPPAMYINPFSKQIPCAKRPNNKLDFSSAYCNFRSMCVHKFFARLLISPPTR